jgi:hypothetical protein
MGGVIIAVPTGVLQNFHVNAGCSLYPGIKCWLLSDKDQALKKKSNVVVDNFISMNLLSSSALIYFLMTTEEPRSGACFVLSISETILIGIRPAV